MKTEVPEIKEALINILKEHQPLLKVTADTKDKFEVTGTVPAMQGRKKVDGMYFASVVPKPKDVRLYFFPIYTHVDKMQALPTNLKKYLKGKSCFHIKKLDGQLEKNIRSMVEAGVELYKKDGLL